MTVASIASTRRARRSIGALLLSAACVAAAPARAAEPTTPNAPLTVADWQAVVGRQLENRVRAPWSALRASDLVIGKVDVSFDRDGSFTGAVARHSGLTAVDREMIRVANRIAYPPLPAGLRGRAHTVTLQAFFGYHAEEAAFRDRKTGEALASRSRAKRDAARAVALPSG